MEFHRKYLKAFTMGFQSRLEYRADFILSIFSGIFIIIIQCFIWKAVFASSPESVIEGYTFPQMIAYSVLAGLVSKILSADFQSEIAADVKNGGLNKFIVQPVQYLPYQFFCFLGKKVPQLIILVFISGAVLISCNLLVGLILEPVRLLLFAAFVCLAMILNFLIYYCLSALAFIMAEVWGVFVGAGQIILILSGGVFPIDVFGKTAAGILNLLPFRYLIFYPVNIVTGRLPLNEIA